MYIIAAMKFPKLSSLLKRSLPASAKRSKKAASGSRFKRNVLWSAVASFAAFTVLLNPSATQALKDYLPPALERPLTQLQDQKWLQQLGQELEGVDVAGLIDSVAGLFGEDGLAMLDLWNPDKGVTRVLAGYGRGNQPLPVYKMPHLEGWTVAENLAFVPAVGQHQVLVLNMLNWTEQGRIDVLGQPVFVMARPDARQIWVNFAYPDNQYVQIIDSQTQAIIKTIEPGPGVLHMEFTPRGEQIWISVRDRNEVQIWDTRTLEHLYTLEANSPSGIFFSNRAHRIGL